MAPRLPILTLAGLLGGGVAAVLLQSMAHPGGATGASAAQDPAARGLAMARGSPTALKGANRGAIDPPGSGQQLLEQAIRTLEGRRSVSAKIRQSVDLFGQGPVGSGVYFEERSEKGLRFRWEIRLQLAGEPSSLLDVCDGRFLWRYQKLGDDETLRRIDVRRVQEALEDFGETHRLGEVGAWPGLGGLPKLLRGLHSAFNFDSVEEAELVGHVPVWRLRGEWKPEALGDLVPEMEKDGQGRAGGLKDLPAHVPDHVFLYLGKADWFPYRVEYRQRTRRQGRGAGREDRSLVTMELFLVDLNAAIDPTQFLYNPGDLEYSDETASFLKSLDLAP